MSSTFAAPAPPKKRPSEPSAPRRRSYTEHRRAARRAAGDRSLRARLVKGRSLVHMAVAARDNGSRWPFLALFALIAGVSVIALLMLNNATAQTSFTERKLSQELAELSLVEQQLRQEVAAKQAPSALAEKATELGMQPGANPGNLVIHPDGSVTWIEPRPLPTPPPPPAAEPAPASAVDGADQAAPALPQDPAAPPADPAAPVDPAADPAAPPADQAAAPADQAAPPADPAAAPPAPEQTPGE